MKKLALLLLLPLQVFSQELPDEEISRLDERAQAVTIIRDNWGIPHIYGKTDADAVFGLMYAQCEDNFNRVETNYIKVLGRLAEVEGFSQINNDLRMRLLADTADAKADYQKAPPYLKKLLDAFADGVNYFLYKNPEIKPSLLTQFRPWYPLMWTNGSIDAFTSEDVTAGEIGGFYLNKEIFPENSDKESQGTNAFAISPSHSTSGNAMLYLNPHVNLFFRTEVHMVSEEGLNTYGAVTWGQFFVYQGFNEHCGWMHSSSHADGADLYIENVTKTKGGWTYKYNGLQKPVTLKKITLNYKSGDKVLAQNVTGMFTQHGPILVSRNDQWISLKTNNRSLNGLIQSWQRTKATNLASFKKTLELLSDNSDNTMYADAEGNVAYWHGNFIPVRDRKYDWSKPVDGSIAATEWKGLHKTDELVHLLNPANGWIQNCNSSPFNAAGINSPKKEKFPSYMAPEGENFRSLNATRLLEKEKKISLDGLIALGYDRTLTAFEVLIPALLSAYETVSLSSDSLFQQLENPMALLKNWDHQCSETSVETTLAVEWAQKLLPLINEIKEPDQIVRTIRYLSDAPPEALITPFVMTIKELEKKFGRWEVEWGDINRYQRVPGPDDLAFGSNYISLPIAFAAGTWGMLPSFSSRYPPGSSERYGVHGNSFVCAVEFGKKIKARSLLAGGESADPNSPHFEDQAEMYTKGTFKDVLFYKEDILKHVERGYHPGE